MWQWRRLVLLVCLLIHQPLSSTGNLRQAVAEPSPDQAFQVRRNYLNTCRYLVSSRAIILEGSAYQIMRLSRWLDEIIDVPHGRATLQAIFNSGNQLIIRHSNWALEVSGRTLGPATDSLSNGRGEDGVIFFNARI